MKKLLKLLFAISFFLTLSGAAYAEADFNYSDISEVTYKILYPSIPSNVFPDNGKQTMTPSKNDICYVKVFSEGIKNRNFAYPIKKNNKNKKLLKSNPYIDSSDERIKEIAAIFTKDEKNVLNIILKSQNWVEQNIKNNPTEHLPRTTKEVLDNFEGNQNEKILIISAILKAAGVPNKVVIGMHYNMNKAMPKLWLSVYTDQWNDVDPTSDRLDIFTPDNICFYQTFLDNKNELAFFDGTKNLPSNFDISILNTKSNLQITIDKISNPITSDVSEINLLKYIRGDNTAQLSEFNLRADNDNDDMIKVKTRSDLRQEEAMQKGFYAFVDGDIEQSISYFEKASEQFPINNDFLNFDYASMLAKIGLFDLSQKRLINISDYQIWNKRIENLYKVSYPKTIPQRDEEIALAKATSAVSFSRNIPEDIQELLPYKKYKNSDYANYLYSKYYFKKSDFKKSETFIKRALKIYPENYQYKYNLADILSRREKYDRTLKVLTELDLSQILDKRLSKNIQLLEYSTRASKTKDIVMKNYYMANYYFAKSDFQQAQGFLKENIQRKPQMIENYLLNAQINLGKDDYLKAESDYQAALKINSDNEEALLGLGDINLFLNNKQKAYDFYAKALKNNKKSLNAMKKMANYHEASSNNDYITYYKKIQELYPEDIDSLLKLAESDYLRGDKIQANEKYKKILSLDQNCAQAWFGLSKIAIDNKNTYIAREYLLPVYYLNKFNPEYYYYSGLINNIDQNYPQAMVDFKKALELDPSNIKSLIELKKMN